MFPRFTYSPLLKEWTVHSLLVDQTHFVLESGTLVQKAKETFSI